jgi:hypothetical protein
MSFLDLATDGEGDDLKLRNPDKKESNETPREENLWQNIHDSLIIHRTINCSLCKKQFKVAAKGRGYSVCGDCQQQTWFKTVYSKN